MQDILTLCDLVLERRGTPEEDDPGFLRNVRDAVEEAVAHLRSFAGNPKLTFEDAEDRNLVITCAWYFLENQRAEFDRVYSGDLIALRMKEAFGCGKDQNSDLS